MKKVLSCVMALIIMAFSFVTASAADAKFSLRVISQNDSQAVLSFDYEGGTAVAAMDFNVVVKEGKLKVTKIESGQGLKNAMMQATVFASPAFNVDKSPASVSMAIVPGYRNVNGKDLFVITVQKLVAGDITNGDVTIQFENCVDDNGAALVTGIDYALGGASAPADPNAPTSAAENTSTTSPTSAQGTPAESNTSGQANAAVDAEAETETETETETKGDNKTVIIIVCAVAAVAVAGGVAVFVIKKKKAGAEDKESKEG